MKKIFKFNVIFSIIGFGLLVVGTYLILSAMFDAFFRTFHVAGSFDFLMKLPHHFAKDSGEEMLYHFFVVTMRLIVYFRYN